tara:strand:- start:1080 stop:1460 length:381 start_codon:yes stop_codon:yes gene_type:complete
MKWSLFSLFFYCASAFYQNAPLIKPKQIMHMGFFDGVNKAFENEVFDTDTDRDANKAYEKILINICGKKVMAVKGQRLIDLIRASGAPIAFNCGKGDCGSCLCIVNGKKMRVCRMVVTGPLTIKKI